MGGAVGQGGGGVGLEGAVREEGHINKWLMRINLTSAMYNTSQQY